MKSDIIDFIKVLENRAHREEYVWKITRYIIINSIAFIALDSEVYGNISTVCSYFMMAVLG